MVNTAGFGGGDDVGVGSVSIAVGEIFLNRAREKPGILKHHTEELANVSTAHFAGGDAVNGDVAAARVVEAHQEVDERGLAGAGGTDDGDLHTGFNFDGEMLDDWALRVIGEVDVMEFNGAFDVADHLGRFRIGSFFGFVQEGEDAFGGGHGLLDAGGDLGNAGERAVELADVLDEGLDAADAENAGDGLLTANHADGDIAQVGADVDNREGDGGIELGFPGAFIEALVAVGKIRKGQVFMRVGLDDGLTGVIFFNGVIEGAERNLLVAEIFLGELGEAAD